MAVPASPSADAPPVQVPRTNRDPIRSLRPASVQFDVGGKSYEIPALPAADWLQILMRDEWSPDELILELTPNAIEVVLDLNVDAVYDLALDILEEVSGRYWWVAVRIVGAVTYAWDVMGPEGIFHGVDPERLSLAAWLDAMLLLLLRRIDPQQAPMFTARLEMPPEGEEVPEEEMEISAAQFMSMAGD